jgi:hypothetical protein
VILHGDCLSVLKTLPANSVHMVVTSPPYWSLRDYGVPPTVWGGNPLCAHVWESAGTREGYSAKKKWQHSMTNEPDSNGRGEPRGGRSDRGCVKTTRTAGRRSSRGSSARLRRLARVPRARTDAGALHRALVLVFTKYGACCGATARAG